MNVNLAGHIGVGINEDIESICWNWRKKMNKSDTREIAGTLKLILAAICYGVNFNIAFYIFVVLGIIDMILAFIHAIRIAEKALELKRK